MEDYKVLETLMDDFPGPDHNRFILKTKFYTISARK